VHQIISALYPGRYLYHPQVRRDGARIGDAKQLVALMQGTISVESTPGQGTPLWFSARFARQTSRSAASTLSGGLTESPGAGRG
jgi:hypothetical protein